MELPWSSPNLTPAGRPFLTAPWPKTEEPIYDSRVFISARPAAIRYQDPVHETYLRTFPNPALDCRNLFWPPPAAAK